MYARLLIIIAAFAIASCEKDIKNVVKGLLEDGGGGQSTAAKYTNTFGQLLSGNVVAHYTGLQYTPNSFLFKAPSDGRIEYFADLGGLTHCLIFTPKAVEDGSGGAEVHPDFAEGTDLKLAFCNFENSGDELKDRIRAIWEKRGLTDDNASPPLLGELTLATDGFMTRDDNWKVLDVYAAEADGSGATELGEFDLGQLQLAAYVPDDPNNDEPGVLLDGTREYFNVMEYLKPFVTTASLKGQLPEIGDLFIEAAPAAGMASAVTHDYDLTTGNAVPIASMEDFLRITVELEARNSAAADGPTVVPFQVSYSLDKLTLDPATGAETARTTVSKGRAAMTRMRTLDTATIATALYDVPASDPVLDRYRLRLPIDPNTAPPAGDPDWIRATDPSVITELNTDAMNGGSRQFPVGDYELSVTVKDIFDATGPDSTKTVRLVIEPALVFVSDRADDNTIDHTDPHIDHAQPGHWGDDTTVGALPAVDGYTAANAVVNTLAGTFIDNDSYRFYLRARDFPANADPAARDTVTAQIGTLQANGTTIDDDLTTITLRESGNNTGIFVSAAQLLTGEDVAIADNPDDDFAVHDGISAALAIVADDAAGDRTHRVVVDGQVRGEFTPTAPAVLVRSEIDVCRRNPEKRKVLNLRLFNFLEPFNNTGYDPDGAGPLPVIGNANTSDGTPTGTPIFDFDDANGNSIHDPGEMSEQFIDISGGAVAFASGDAGGGTQRGVIWTNAQIDRQMVNARSLLAQACIRIVELSRTPTEPTGTLFRNLPGLFDDFPADVGGATPTLDETEIANNHRTLANPMTDTAIDVYFTAPFSQSAAAEAFPPFTTQAGVMGLANNFIHMAIIGLNTDTGNFTMVLAHENGHLMANVGDAAANPHILFPATPVPLAAGSTHNNSRRVQATTETDFLTTRTTIGGAGNTFLQAP